MIVHGLYGFSSIFIEEFSFFNKKAFFLYTVAKKFVSS